MKFYFVRPPDQDPEEFKENVRLAVKLYRLYEEAGCPYGRSSEALKVWWDYGQTARRN